MKIYRDRLDQNVVQCLRHGGVGVLKTDTLYGIVALATNQAAVERVYTLRQRNIQKACIILLASAAQLPVQSPDYAQAVIDQRWPGPVSIIMPVGLEIPQWLHRGNASLAFRVPADAELYQLLRQTGPLIAPSANLEGRPPATTITEARRYFGDSVDFYVDSGAVDHMQPSEVIKPLPNGTIEQLR